MSKIKDIQSILLKYFNKNSWQQYTNSLKFSKCDYIAYLVSKICNDSIGVEIQQNYSKLAIQQLHKNNDFNQMYGNHYLNEYNNQLYDFGKGANCINGIYLLKYNNFDKYTITLTDNEKSLITKKYYRQLNSNKYKIKKQYIGILNNQSEYLYHATYKALLPSIRQNGLGNSKIKMWENSKSNVVYLANNPDIAESYAEISENIPNQNWLDEIIIFQINKKYLNKNKLFVDENVLLNQNEEPSTFEYHGIIPFDCLQIYKQNNIEKTYLKSLNINYI